jgi:hypothetical protein
MESTESFKARAEEHTGVRFEALPDVPPEALLEGEVLCERDGTYVVTVGYPISEDPETGVKIYGAFGVVDRARLSAPTKWRITGLGRERIVEDPQALGALAKALDAYVAEGYHPPLHYTGHRVVEGTWEAQLGVFGHELKTVGGECRPLD